MTRKTINPDKLFNSTPYGFSQIAISPPGKHVFISGQVAWDAEQNIIGHNDLAGQTRKALENIKIAIEAAGGTIENLMMIRIYKVHYEQKDGPVINGVLKEYFGTDNPPASTWISVDGLANKDFLIEIEAQAIV
ncbi:MAG: RidA family protein [Saprospiraceae bacterium]|nr:RidA family protein [Saprospiraceae bacterium]